MESPKAEVAFRAAVVAIEQKFTRRWHGGIGSNAIFSEDSLGWFVGLENSYEFLHVGYEKPNIEIGDIATIRITFNAKPSQPPV